MRLITRLLGFLLVVLLAFWFTAENAGRLVTVDFVLMRIQASVPLVVFGSVLLGMGVAFFVGWRAERGRPVLRPGEPLPMIDSRRDLFDPGMHEIETEEAEHEWS
jgi:hypothetical protein